MFAGARSRGLGDRVPARVINCGYNRAIYSDRSGRTLARTLMASHVDLGTSV